MRADAPAVAGIATPPEDQFPVIALDMDAVYAEAIASREWVLSFDSDGQEFVWSGKAKSEAAAEIKARNELHTAYPEFSKWFARLVRKQVSEAAQ